MDSQKIIVIDDDVDICLLLNRFLTRNGFVVETAQTGKDGLQKLDEGRPDLIMTDFKLGDMNGVEILKYAKAKYPDVPVIIITGYSDIKVAINVMKQGAFDYVTKPLFPEEILLTIKKALAAAKEPAHSVTIAETASSASATDATPDRKKNKVAPPSSDPIFGEGPASQNLLKQIKLVAPTSFSVIIYGESGSGKEAIAREIHRQSLRSKQPFVAMDCGAISKELASSELFGHEKGSFTGALNQKIGHFELANGGTLFLDEIGNLSYEVQISLLRVVQERKVKRLGGTKEIDLDVRIIVASNERLPVIIREGKFREDLYHRFNEFNIDVPPLRERGRDILLFANHFLALTNYELGKAVEGFSDEVVEHFLNYPWHGNLRELNNVVKRATLLSEGKFIEVSSLPFELVNHRKMFFAEVPPATPPAPQPMPPYGGGYEQQPMQPVYAPAPTVAPTDLKAAAHEAEFETILNALRQTNYNKSKAAKLLNIDRKTLYNKMKLMNI